MAHIEVVKDEASPALRRLAGPAVARELEEVVEAGVRTGVASARLSAPYRTFTLVKHIDRTQVRTLANVKEASFGIQPARNEEDPKRVAYPHWGTGLYGARNDLIRPRVAPVMTFFSLGRWWRLATVRGQHPQSFMHDARQDASDAVGESLDGIVRRILRADR